MRMITPIFKKGFIVSNVLFFKPDYGDNLSTEKTLILIKLLKENPLMKHL